MSAPVSESYVNAETWGTPLVFVCATYSEQHWWATEVATATGRFASPRRNGKREYFRPVAPVCLEETVGEHFDWSGPSPHMLYFQNVSSPRLSATTHLDGTARVQTINESQDRTTYELLREMIKRSGFGVACNTSLNFLGKGFINRSSDLARYAGEQKLDAVVVNERMYVRSGAV